MALVTKATAVTADDLPVPAVPVPGMPMSGMSMSGRSAEIMPFRPPVRPIFERLREHAAHAAGVLLPPLIVIAVTLVVWQLLCSEAGSRLPPPTKVVADAWDFIADPTTWLK